MTSRRFFDAKVTNQRIDRARFGFILAFLLMGLLLILPRVLWADELSHGEAKQGVKHPEEPEGETTPRGMVDPNAEDINEALTQLYKVAGPPRKLNLRAGVHEREDEPERTLLDEPKRGGGDTPRDLASPEKVEEVKTETK